MTSARQKGASRYHDTLFPVENSSVVRTLRSLLAAAALAGCSPPQFIQPYRMEIQQGNYISQEMVSQLRPGMTKEQVRYVLGTPLVTDIFHADRWDYVYYRDTRRGPREERKIAILFESGRLARVVGDVVAAEPKADAKTDAPRAGAPAATNAPRPAEPPKPRAQ